MTGMYDPASPGEVLAGWLEDLKMTVTAPRVARGSAATRRQPAAATLGSPPFGTLEIVALPG